MTQPGENGPLTIWEQGDCPGTTVNTMSGPVTQPCDRPLNHPGSCTPYLRAKGAESGRNDPS